MKSKKQAVLRIPTGFYICTYDHDLPGHQYKPVERYAIQLD